MFLEGAEKKNLMRYCLSKYYSAVLKDNNLPEGISCTINGD